MRNEVRDPANWSVDFNPRSGKWSVDFNPRSGKWSIKNPMFN